MFRRMRSRLFVSFLSVSLLAMIPSVVIPYYITLKTEDEIRSDRMKSEFDRYGRQHAEFNALVENQILLPMANRLKETTFGLYPELERQLLQLSLQFDTITRQQYATLKGLLDEEINKALINGTVLLEDMKNRLQSAELDTPYENQIRNQILRDLLNDQIVFNRDYKLLNTVEYFQHRVQYSVRSTNESEDDEEGQLLFRLIQEEGSIYSWVLQPITKEHEGEELIIGGLLIRFPYIDLNSLEDDRVQKIAPMLIDSPIDVVRPEIELFRPYMSEAALERLFDTDGDKNVGNVGGIRMTHPRIENGELVQANLLPLYNQNTELIAILVVSEPVVELYQPLIYWMLQGLPFTMLLILVIATFVARSLSRPIGDLATASQTMAEGRFDVRVPISGTEEQRVLSSAFNRMAQRIEQQMAQLQRQTRELEDSNTQLNQTHRFLQNVLANISTGVLSVDKNGNIHHLNPVGEKLFGITDWAGKPFQSLIPSASFVDLVVDALRTRQSLYRHEQVCSVGDDESNVIPLQISIVPLREQGNLGGLVVTFHDLSEIRRLEDQVRRQDRLAALGRMSAGVAHEIRNPLGIIRGSAQLLKKRFGDQPGEEGLCEFIIEEVQRLSRVVNDFLMFARPPMPVKDDIEIDALFEQFEAYLQSETGKHTYRISIEPGLPRISIDAGLFREAFLNLFLNAQEAMPDGGEVHVSARKWGQDSIAIEVADTGVGMDAEQIDRIFDPFYTSKDNGTGLGLSLVHQIISSHGGNIEAESTSGEGSTFRVILPINSIAEAVSMNELAPVN